jgi:hypothetical protein
MIDDSCWFDPKTIINEPSANDEPQTAFVVAPLLGDDFFPR